MKKLLDRFTLAFPSARLRLAALLVITLAVVGVVYADVPGRIGPRGTVPNPGTQQQELANITFPAPYNVYEFVVTCAACHGGTIDQQAAHFGNWAGTAMASAARDPVFRANNLIVNNAVKALTGKDGAGNMCFRCHSPNGWYSGRFDPTLAGAADGSTMHHSILLSTDDEGILCEFCHRTIGGVTMKRADLDQNDPVWNMMASIDDWPHAGDAYPDGPVAGNPYGDTTLQINDGMTYGGKFPGSVAMYFSDTPLAGTYYTGQTYGVYPPGWKDEFGNDVGGQPVVNPDGSTPIHFEVPIGPPLNPDSTYNYQAQSISLEHPTFDGEFVKTPEFCGSCHDLTIPVLNHGMPEQRTYTEWRYSDFGRDEASATYVRCQDCHMPTQMHEYADGTAVSLNPDPTLTGWFPYAKNRNINPWPGQPYQPGTAFHKLSGANRDLPDMMTLLYPEVDLEVIGAPTGNDTRVFPGMLSNRDTMWDRAQRNTEVSLLDAIDVQITSGPTLIDAVNRIWEVKVKVTNNTGHRVPSGYPDGRRFWINLVIRDAFGNLIYESGHYDPNTAKLYTDPFMTGLARAQTTTIDSLSNAVMIYEKRTGACDDPVNPTACTMSVSLLNDKILFDNRIPPAGFTYADYRLAGAKFYNYNPNTFVPYEDVGRFPDGQNWDEVTYHFRAPNMAVLTASAKVYWQTHTREFMEHLKNEDTSTLRPQGPPSIFELNYPLTPNYLSDVVDLSTLTDMDGQPLRDNWGGIAYAAWLLTGKGAPYLVAADSTALTAPPATPANLATTVVDPFTIQVTWNPVANADGYLLWVRYGQSDATASWDKLAVVYDATSFLHEALNVAKSYAYRVQAFNGKGLSAASTVMIATTPTDLPLPPENLTVVGTTSTSVTLSWYDAADNETGFVIERQDVPVTANFYEIARIPTPNNGGVGGVSWTDTTAQPGRTYNYRVAAYNASGMSTYSLPVQATTGGPPGGTIVLTATAANAWQVDLAWSGATGDISGYRVERSTTSATGPWSTTFDVPNPLATGYSDTTVSPQTTYWYRVFAYNAAGDSAPSNVAMVTTPAETPAAPTNLVATAVSSTQVNLTWTDNATNETGFYVERSDDGGLIWSLVGQTAANVTTFSDLTVEPKMTYSYRVAAFNAAGNSPYSNVATVVTPGQIPEAPSGLTVVGVTRSLIALSWLDNSTNENGFYVERSANGGTTWSRIATTGPNVTGYIDRGLPRFTTYWYRVQAFNADGVSAYSETVSATTR